MVLAGDGVGDNGVESRGPCGVLFGMPGALGVPPGGALGVVDVVWALKAVEPSDGEKADSGRAIGGAADGAGAIGEAVELSDGEKADSSRAIGGAADSAGALGEAVESSDSEAAVDMNDGEAAVEPGDGETADSSRAIRGGAAGDGGDVEGVSGGRMALDGGEGGEGAGGGGAAAGVKPGVPG